jgi:hypothetical protein
MVLNEACIGENKVIETTVFADENGDEYLVTIFDGSNARLAVRPKGARTWGAPLPITRTERTELE